MNPLTRALIRKICTAAMLGIVAASCSCVPTAFAAGTLFVIIGTGGTSVRVGETRNYYAVLVRDDGTIVNPVTATWSVTGPATVDSAGNVTGTATAANAQAVVTATFSDPVLTGGATLTGTQNVTIQASQDVWTGGGGPAQGGDVRGLTTVGSTILAAIYGGGVYRTTGGGWEPSFYGIPFRGTARVRALRVVPNTTNVVVAAVEGSGIFRSSDGGSSWVSSNTGMGCNFPRGFTARTSNNSLYVYADCGAYKSTDGGVSWSSVSAGLPSGAVQALQAFSGSETVWAAVAGAGLYRSTNGGASWTPMNNGLPAGPYGLQVYSFNAVTTGLYLAMVEGAGIYRSSDSGANWVPQNSGLPASYGFQGGIGRQSDGYLYVAIDGYGIYRGTTGSNTSDPVTWSAWGNTAAQLPLRSHSPSLINGVYYVATGRGVYTSSDNGVSWTAFSTGLPGGYVINSVTDPGNTNVVYATGNTVYKSTDGGVNWNASGAGITGAVSLSRSRGSPGNITRGGDGALYVSTVDAGIFKSTDSAASWTPVNSGLPALIAQGMGVRNDAVDPQTIYALFGADPYGVWKSVNGGTSWSSISGDLAGNALRTREIAKDSATGNLYLATNGGVYKSVNGGVNWTPVYTATSANHVRIDTGTTPSTVYWSTFVNDGFNQPQTSSGVYKSTDQGASFTQILSGRLVNNLRVVRPGGQLQLYAASWNSSSALNQSRVLRSLDGGANWESVSAGMRHQFVGSFDAVNQQLVRASTRGNGVFNFVPAVITTTPPVNPNQPVAPPPVTQTEYTVTTGVIPQAAVSTTASGTLGSVTLNVTLDLSLLAGSFTGQGYFAAGYNVYVAALVPSGRLGLPAAAWFMLPSTRNWAQLAFPMGAYLQNVAQSASVSIGILQNMDMTELIGTEFYIGYGLSDQEMLAAGRFRGVYIAR